MRTIALAEEFSNRNIEPIFISRDYPSSNFEIINKKSFSLIKIAPNNSIAKETQKINQILNKQKYKAIIMDGYEFDYEYQRSIVANFLVAIGSNGDTEQYADMVVNPNLWSDKKFVPGSVKKDSIYLSGPDYILLREDFRGDKIDIKSQCSDVLITLGGGKQNNFAYKIYDSLNDKSKKFYLAGRDFAEHKENSFVNLEIVDDTYNLSSLMKKCDIAICGAGVTSLELMSLGVPFLYYIVAENQINSARIIEKYNAGINMGMLENFQGKKLKQKFLKLAEGVHLRKEMHENQSKISAFNGSERVVKHILERTGKL